MSGDRGPILRKRTSSSTNPPAPPEAPKAPRETSVREDAPRASIDASDRRNGPNRPRPERSESNQGGPSNTRRREAPPREGPREANSRNPGRRLYDPSTDRSGGPRPAPAGVVQGDRKRPLLKAGGKNEKTEQKNQAVKLSKEKSIPLVHAYRILKGQTTLNDVLKGMMRKERFEQLIEREGVDRELAGQVASGHLPKQRAILLSRMRTLRSQKLHVDGIKAAEMEKRTVALDLFGKGWTLGRVRSARPYDFDFLAQGETQAQTFFKHDVKALCTAEDLEVLRPHLKTDPAIVKEGLGATEDRGQRVRPSDDRMLDCIDQKIMIAFTMRDGEVIPGYIRSFGRWDVDIETPAGTVVTLFFHGLHLCSTPLPPFKA